MPEENKHTKQNETPSRSPETPPPTPTPSTTNTPTPSTKKSRGLKGLLFFLIAVGCAGGGTFWVNPQLFSFINIWSGKNTNLSHLEDQQNAFISLDPFVVNLNNSDGKQHFLKLSLVLELTSQGDTEQITKLLPRIVDTVQIYLRGIRVDDLEGSQGIYTIKTQLLDRANRTISPLKVKNVLLKDILVQ